MSTISENAKSIFLEAIEKHSPEEWPEFLGQACGADRVLRGVVEGLLRAHAEKDSLFDHTDVTREFHPLVKLGQRIGPFKIREQIGDGGMGEVYVAEQEKPLRRKVALKVIKPGMDSRAILARFDAERNALALMNHRNIAKVLDAGSTDEGRPYFVMELVSGIPITDYCDQRRLGIRDRLNLFIQVCQAIQHAHTKGVIHRDIKPSNVLVAEEDGKPMPKIIDFGVAKALNQTLTEYSIYTSFQSIVGTPLYMSPEQASLSNVDVDTSSDVYSLGILLYELLTGTTPLNLEELKRIAQDEILRQIREQEPPRPSNRISTLGETSTTVSQSRGTEPDQLGRLVKGDLDWIVMKALEKDRNRRYRTVDAFAADIARHLSNEPVEARPPSTAYRLSRFYRRNRVLAVSVATCFLVLLVAVIGTASALRIAIREKEHSDTSRRELEEKNARLVVAEERLDETRVKLTDSLFDSGMMLALAGEYDTAENYKILLSETDAVEQRVLLGAFLDLAQNRYAEAIDSLQRVAKEKPENFAIRALLTICYDAAGQPTNWFHSHQAMAGMQPTSSEDFLLATFSSYTLDPALAMSWSEKALELRRSPMAYLVRARATAEYAMHSGHVDNLDRAFQDAMIANSWFENAGLSGFTVLATYLFAVSALQDEPESDFRLRLFDSAGQVANELQSRKNKMAIWDDAYLAHYFYMCGDKERAFVHALRATKPRLSDNPSAHYLALAYELGRDPDSSVLYSAEADGVAGYSDYVLGFLRIVKGDVDGGVIVANSLIGMDTPFDIKLRGVELLHLAGKTDLATEVASDLKREYSNVELDSWSRWTRENVLQYFIDLDEEQLIAAAADSNQYRKRWLAFAHSAMAAVKFGLDKTASRTHAELCVEQGVFYLFFQDCWLAALAHEELWKE